MTVNYKLLDNKYVNCTICVWSCIFIAFIGALSIYAVIKVEAWERDLALTKQSIEQMEQYFGIMKDLDDYELEFGSADNDYDLYKDDVDGDDYVPEDADDNEEYNDTKTRSALDNNMLIKIGAEMSRSKRDVLAATRDGIIIKSESYAEFRKKNKTKTKEVNGNVPKTTLNFYDELDMKTTPKPKPITVRKSRVMKVDDKSKTRKRFRKPMLKSLDDSQEQGSGQDMTVIRDVSSMRRRHRQRLEMLDENPLRLSKLRPQLVIHLSGDTSKYVLGQHHNFKGNGHLRHNSKTFVDWKPESWVQSFGMNQHFTLRDGTVTVKESGLYFIYSQIYYLDEHDTNGYHVCRNNEMLLQCTTMSHSTERILKGNTCYTGGAFYLAEGDKIEIRDISDSRYSLFEPGKSFFGLIKLGDIKLK